MSPQKRVLRAQNKMLFWLRTNWNLAWVVFADSVTEVLFRILEAVLEEVVWVRVIRLESMAISIALLQTQPRGNEIWLTHLNTHGFKGGISKSHYSSKLMQNQKYSDVLMSDSFILVLLFNATQFIPIITLNKYSGVYMFLAHGRRYKGEWKTYALDVSVAQSFKKVHCKQWG